MNFLTHKKFSLERINDSLVNVVYLGIDYDEIVDISYVKNFLLSNLGSETYEKAWSFLCSYKRILVDTDLREAYIEEYQSRDEVLLQYLSDNIFTLKPLHENSIVYNHDLSAFESSVQLPEVIR